ncbi:flagellar biosynthesis protein FlhB [Aquifex aeolicus]|uniref:Flagellar biosynthetic protein FlhB n=2 Tax=Aquifex aeolicus TaxID=63363 RepID=FLHB_AQUAE|nr:flagellar biosynthesis protein FlhB [Aquifex aeolicus]O67813.1 RecName: Full=Flagellar biosynthetic protein FlhB [Aquifex aeolicus VF5]AAC07777.1 flagellar biosynthetic protein FlhB [Aquifex aeolicus VF5]
MAEEHKTERATPYKRRKVREEGNVAKSHEIASSLVVLLSLLLLLFLGTYIAKEVILIFLAVTGYVHADISELGSLYENFYENIVKVLTPLFFLALLVVILSHVAQFGFIFTLKPLSFKWERINPFEGIKRLISLTTLFETVKNTLKAFLLIGIAVFVLKGSLYFFLSSSTYPLAETLKSFIKTSAITLITLGVVALLIAFLDYAFKRWQYEKKIMMSRRELKEEYKQLEGHPEVKSRIKARMRELAKSRMMAEVPKATVVITNPTHIAIALKYNPEKDKAPVVVAKGKGTIAQKIVEIAENYSIPVVRKPELARALYPAVEVGKEISPKFYKAVAEIIAYVMFKKKKVYA